MIAFSGLDEYATAVEGLRACAERGDFYDVLAERQRKAAEESAARGAVSKMMLQQQEMERQRQMQGDGGRGR